VRPDGACRDLVPALLDRRGLIPALSAQLDLTHPHARLDIHEADDRRLNRAIDPACYLFCAPVASTDLRSLIQLRVDADRLIAAVTADNDPRMNPGPCRVSVPHPR